MKNKAARRKIRERAGTQALALPMLQAQVAGLPDQDAIWESGIGFSGRKVTEIIFVVHEPPEGGYSAEALGHSIFTIADTLEELSEMVRDAVVCHFDEPDRPKIIRLHFVRDEVIAV